MPIVFKLGRDLARRSKRITAAALEMLDERKRRSDFRRQLREFKKRFRQDGRFAEENLRTRPMLHDRDGVVQFDRHYFYHPAWAARVIAEIRPEKHVDISSIAQFAAEISAFIPLEYYELNAPDIALSNLKTGKADLLNLPFESNSIESLSCMHVVEHVGLGRYGDPLDPQADLAAASQLERVVRPGGHLLFVVPVGGVPTIEFNAHRIYTYRMVRDMFPLMRISEFALIPDATAGEGLVRHAPPDMADSQRYACGCFHFVKGNTR